MRNIFTFTCVFFMTACASTIHTASISEAYKKYDAQEFKRTLELISMAENSKKTTLETKAELTYLKAKTYESMGETGKAVALYKYITEQHANSQYSYLSSKKLKSTL